MMSLIACTEECVYQKDGYCALSRAASPGGTAGQTHHCVNFVPAHALPLQKGRQSLTDIGNANQL